MYGPNEQVMDFYCNACGETYSHVSKKRGGEQITRGAEFCFLGPAHTSVTLEHADKRRVFPHSAALIAGPNLQREIDELPADVELLSIVKGSGFSLESGVVLDRVFLQLRELKLIDTPFRRLRLTPATTPRLRVLTIQNLSNECDAQIVLPELRTFSLHYWHGHRAVVENLLAAATKLETFDSYKLIANEDLVFASPNLTSIDLHRSDLLRSISIWAPRLKELGLQGCFGIDSIEFPATHVLAVALPPDFVCRSPLRVNSENANFGPAAKAALRAHPRIKAAHPSTAHPGMPGGMESFFAAMHSGRERGDSSW